MLSFILVLLLGVFMPAGNLLASDKEQNPHYITVKNSRDLQSLFRYAPIALIVISGHRWWNAETAIRRTASNHSKDLVLYGIVFRGWIRVLTKDRINRIDALLTKPSTGQLPGRERFRFYTYAELQQFNLVDRNGNVTAF